MASRGAGTAESTATPKSRAAAPPKPTDRPDRRIPSAALEYWRDLAAPRRFPSKAQVTRESAGDLWDHLFIVAVGPEGTDPVFIQSGDVLRQALGRDPTGEAVRAAMPRAIANRALYYQRAASDLMAPIDDAGKWIREDGGMVLYRAVLMPLSEDERTANYLLGAFSFRIVPPDVTGAAGMRAT